MQCPSCQHDNATPARFCEACGAQLARSCAACGREASPSARFCGECGASLGEAPPRPGEPARTSAAPAPPAPIAASEAERRQITVLFCDLVGSTPLSQRLDPEELREVMRLYEEAASEVIARFDGHVAQHLGDGILAYFGWPRAHEDDAVRAVSAAIALVGELPSLNERVRASMPDTAVLELQVRAGIHTGLVVVEDIGGAGRAVGETPNVAARLQALAEPNQVLISDATRRLVTGSVVLEDLGAQRLKGLPEPLLVYRALRWSGVRSRLELSAAAGLTPLVGRQEEVGILLNRWEQIQDGAGQVILIAGDAGMGKSRLLQVLRERLVDEPHSWLECRCSPYHESSAFHPIVGLLERGLLFASEDSSDDKLAKLERALGLAGFEPERVVPLFAALLSLPLPDRYPAPMLSPEAQRRKTLEALAAWFLALAALQPLVMVVEDLHWIDPSTVEFLGMLVEQVPTVPVLVVFTFRPSFRPPWSQRSHFSQLTLGRLTRRQAAAMIASLVGGKQLPGEVLEQLVTKTDGVPLFVEELTKMVLESDLLGEREDCFVLRGPLGSLAIPSTLQDSLMTRLDRLGRAKEVAHLAATLGREFSYELIAALHLRGEGELQEALGELVRAELLYQRGAPPEATYTFKHALIQEVAYQSLLRSTRQQYHRSIVTAYEELFPAKAEAQPELLAHHCAEAGMPAQAIAYGRRAAERAATRSANLEAIQQFTRALELLDRIGAGSERDRLELGLRVGLAVPLQLLRGYSSPDVEGVYAQARELCEALGETPQILPVLHGLWRFYLVRGDLRAARQLSQSLLRMADASGDPDDRLLAEWAEGATRIWVGEPTVARAHLEASIALYDPARHGALALTYGSDPRVSCLVWLSIALWMLGDIDRGSVCIEEAVRLARESEHPFNLAWAIVFKAANHQFRGEALLALADAEEGIRIATEQAFPLWYGVGVLLRGWAQVALGHTDVELEPLQQAMATLAGTGQELAGTYFMQVLADVYEAKGKPAEALQVLGLGAALVKKNGEALFEGELVRRRGELLRREAAPAERGARSEAETCFHEALETARRQGARTLELRAATSLARLWNDEGQRNEARELLAPIHAAFSEGLETRDLREATALLRELGPAAIPRI